MSWLYFIQEGDGGAIKIGYSVAGAERRRRDFQCGNSAKLKVLGQVSATPNAEREWHQRFAFCRKHLEWFWPEPALLAAINEALTAAPCETVITRWNGKAMGFDDLEQYARTLGMSLSQFSKAIGYAPGHLNMLRANRQDINPRVAYRIQAYTCGEISAEALLVSWRQDRQLWKAGVNPDRYPACAA